MQKTRKDLVSVPTNKLRFVLIVLTWWSSKKERALFQIL